AIAVESIAFANCFLISAKQKLAAGKCAHEHEQSRTGQMEIRKQTIDDAKAIGRINKDVRFARLRHDFTLVGLDCFKQLSFKRYRFENADDGCSDGYNALGFVDFVCGFWRGGKALRMHAMIGCVFGPHREKRSNSHMQRDECMRNLLQDLLGEVEPGSWSGNCAG